MLEVVHVGKQMELIEFLEIFFLMIKLFEFLYKRPSII